MGKLFRSALPPAEPAAQADGGAAFAAATSAAWLAARTVLNRWCDGVSRASKTRYLQQARNAKAMADALSYSSEPVKPKQAAMDAAMAYKAAQAEKDNAAPARPKTKKIQCDIVNAEVSSCPKG
jgi:hypothetical protein